MCTLTAPSSTRTVPLPSNSVNTLVPMSTRGERLRGFLQAWSGGAPDWRAKAAAASGVKPGTISNWCGHDAYPEMNALAQLANGLGLQPWELVAVMDGQRPVRPNLDSLIEAIAERTDPLIADQRDGRAQVAALSTQVAAIVRRLLVLEERIDRLTDPGTQP